MRTLSIVLLMCVAVCAASAAPEDHRAPNNDAMAWRWNARQVNWGASNAGTRDEFDNPDDIARRVKELKVMGITVTQLDGLHFRNAYMDRMPRVQVFAKMIVDACHRAGIKVIEHHSATLTGYRNQSGFASITSTSSAITSSTRTSTD